MVENFFDISKLSNEEIDFYNFSISNIDTYIDKSVQEIAKKYGCGISFIYGFFQKIGVSGLKEFLFKIGFQEGTRNKLIDTISESQYSIEAIEKYLLVNYSLNIKQNIDLLKEQISKVKDLCLQISLTQKLYGFGIGHAEISINEIFGIFEKFGVNCKQFFKNNKTDTLPTDAVNLGKGVMLVYSFRGVHSYTEKFLQKTRANNPDLQIWLITSNINSSWKADVDNVIFINNNVREINYIESPILISIANSYLIFNDFLKNIYIFEKFEEVRKNKEFISEIENLRTGKN